MEENFFNLKKDINKVLIIYSILNGEDWILPFRDQEQSRMFTLSTPIPHCAGGSSHCSKESKEIKENLYGKYANESCSTSLVIKKLQVKP